MPRIVMNGSHYEPDYSVDDELATLNIGNQVVGLIRQKYIRQATQRGIEDPVWLVSRCEEGTLTPAGDAILFGRTIPEPQRDYQEECQRESNRGLLRRMLGL